jgi:hypothetical protein
MVALAYVQQLVYIYTAIEYCRYIAANESQLVYSRLCTAILDGVQQFTKCYLPLVCGGWDISGDSVIIFGADNLLDSSSVGELSIVCKNT